MDEAPWSLNRASFRPKGVSGAPDEGIEPCLISGTLDPSPPNLASLIALADGEWRDEALGFARTFLLFDNRRIDDARALWRTLAAREDVDNRFWKQDESGRWSEGP